MTKFDKIRYNERAIREKKDATAQKTRRKLVIMYSSSDPKKVGENIKEMRKQAKLTQIELAEKLSVHQTAVSQWEKGRTLPDLWSLSRLAQTFDVAVDRILSGDAIAADKPEEYRAMKQELRERLCRIPILGSVQAGVPISAIQDITGSVALSQEHSEDAHEYFALRVRGDSMEPRLLEDDIVIVRQQQDADNGDIVVALINGEATVKKLKKQDDGILLIPFNNCYEPFFYSREEISQGGFQILGRVVEFRARL